MYCTELKKLEIAYRLIQFIFLKYPQNPFAQEILRKLFKLVESIYEWQLKTIKGTPTIQDNSFRVFDFPEHSCPYIQPCIENLKAVDIVWKALSV